MKHTKRILAGLASTVAVLCMASVSPAYAADGYDRCPDGYYCMFSGLDGTGDMVKLRTNTPDLAALGMNDRAKSDWNRTSSTIYLWSDADYTGCTQATSAGPTGKGNFFPVYQDFFSSVQFGGPGGPGCGGSV
ncbi:MULTISPECIES: peptidase inhibitor family I36 protein [unclassified Streptomyces]|uniref:peptidase inhibitor family I36 protein n=1 Tax=unclassified Streptomyces TaxID=2593676 RepID=UPI001BE6C173|nr:MULTISPECIES: peptidase inhibitor family I36 protein [unclassified Streptomyces]MBT2405553.1 peptidase inhibitor family I36 protein [Streptomyces sp. ISL-21]MBT2607768.1 peptidase inhibitor family I36 protein [Streptomyces sp. ISL-87]